MAVKQKLLSASSGNTKTTGSITDKNFSTYTKNGFAANYPVPTSGEMRKEGIDTSKLSNNIKQDTATPSKVTTKASYSTGAGGSGGISGYANFQASQAYNDAMAYTNQLLSQLNSGRTSYTDQINSLMDTINNRASFSYDPDTDPLFQSYLASSMESGMTAMTDTMAQASALTGGYGSTYATAAANGAYNSYIQDAYNNLPEYYQTALDTYNSETNDLYSKLGMYNTADQIEYDRLSNAYQNNFAMANDIYGKDYANYWDSLNYNTSIDQYNQDLAYKYASLAQDQAQYEQTMAYNQAKDKASSSSSSKSGAASSDYSNSDYDYVFKEIDRALENYALDSNEVVNIIDYYGRLGYDYERLENHARGGAENTRNYENAMRDISNALTKGGSSAATTVLYDYASRGYDAQTMMEYLNKLKQNTSRF